MTNRLGIEQAKIITISTAHLHPDTMDVLEACHGNLSEGPSVALRGEGFLLNSHLGVEDALDHDLRAGREASLAKRHPDLVLIRALARGQGAEWINIDRDGINYMDILPSYDGSEIIVPTGDGWKDALSTLGGNWIGSSIIVVDRATLEIIEAGQTPGMSDDPQP